MAIDPSSTRRDLRLALALSAAAWIAAGCAGQGLLYTRVVEPYSTDFDATPSGSRTCRLDEHFIREPVSGARVSVRFTWRALQEAACEAGITNLCYADVETLSFLNGLYERRTLILSGE